MADDTPIFEPTASWCYRFARYTAIPEILQMPEITSGQPVLLRLLTARVLDTHLSTEQQAQAYTRKNAGGEVKVASSVKFFVPYLAEETGKLTNLGKGLFRLPADGDMDEDAVEAAAVDAAEADEVEEYDDASGWIYAFTFPMLRRQDGPCPIKVGKTVNDVTRRVNEQCKSSAAFEQPVVLGSWRVKRMSHMEAAVHSVLKARSRWRESAPGREWFDTTLAEIEAVVQFVGQSSC